MSWIACGERTRLSGLIVLYEPLTRFHGFDETEKHVSAVAVPHVDVVG